MNVLWNDVRCIRTIFKLLTREEQIEITFAPTYISIRTYMLSSIVGLVVYIRCGGCLSEIIPTDISDEPIVISIDTKTIYTVLDTMLKTPKVDRFRFIVSNDTIIIQSMREHTESIAYRSTVNVLMSKSSGVDMFPMTDNILDPFGFTYDTHMHINLAEWLRMMKQNQHEDLTIHVRDGTVCISTSSTLTKNEFFVRTKPLPRHMTYDGTFVKNVSQIIYAVLGVISMDMNSKDEDAYVSIGLVPDYPLQILYETPYLQICAFAANKL